MTYLSRAVFAGASLLLLLSAMALIGFGVSDAIQSIRSPEQSGADAVLDGLLMVFHIERSNGEQLPAVLVLLVLVAVRKGR